MGPTVKRAQVFEFIRTELETFVPQLQPYEAKLVGRLAQTGGYAMLADLYLNAEKWGGTQMWHQCIARESLYDLSLNGDLLL